MTWVMRVGPYSAFRAVREMPSWRRRPIMRVSRRRSFGEEGRGGGLGAGCAPVRGGRAWSQR